MKETIKKKRVKLYGSLAYPLSVGSAAYINREDKPTLITSPVMKFFRLPFGLTYIQTQNTHYVLHSIAGKSVGRICS